MYKILIIGLDELSKTFINGINADNFVFGYDFDEKKIDNFKSLKLIRNSKQEFYGDFVYDIDLIILNIDIYRYGEVIPFFVNLKKSCYIINTNSYKMDIEEINTSHRNKFVSCNFLLLPKYVILNVDKGSNLFCVNFLSNFFKNNNVPTLSFNYKDNNNIFTIYNIFYLLQKSFFKNDNFYFLEPKEIQEYSLCRDIILNRMGIIKKMNDIISFIETLRNESEIKNLIINNSVSNTLKLETDLTFDIFNKIILEKIIMASFTSDDLYNFLNFINVNFTYKLFEEKRITKYLSGIYDVDKLFYIVKGKFKSIISILEFNAINQNKLLQYLNIL